MEVGLADDSNSFEVSILLIDVGVVKSKLCVIKRWRRSRHPGVMRMTKTRYGVILKV